MATIKVDSTAIREKAATFDSIATNIENYTEEIEREIQGMKACGREMRLSLPLQSLKILNGHLRKEKKQFAIMHSF